jgi:hypothetical protein
MRIDVDTRTRDLFQLAVSNDGPIPTNISQFDGKTIVFADVTRDQLEELIDDLGRVLSGDLPAASFDVGT